MSTAAVVGATVFAAMMLFSAASQSDRIDDLERSVARLEQQRDQDRRQVAQLNGRVFLGRGIPDTESGRQ